MSAPNVLANRYASAEMRDIWSPQNKIVAERRLWLAVLSAQAELGVAAHWKYKEGGKGAEKSFDRKITWMRQLLEQAQEGQGNELAGALDAETALLSYVFTGDGVSCVVVTAAGAALVDLAGWA